MQPHSMVLEQFLKLSDEQRSELLEWFVKLPDAQRRAIPFHERCTMYAEVMCRNLNANVLADRLTS
jgi:hypothetical protein